VRGPAAAVGRLGAVPVDNRSVEFRVWAPAARSVEVRIEGRAHPLAAEGEGFHAAVVPAVPGARYAFALDGRPWPDPCSRRQPDGTGGPSAVVEIPPATRGPRLRLEELVLYELHVGAFSEQGTFDAVIPRLGGLRELGITAIELMPVGTFPGRRNWGYDGLYSSAPHEAYGGPAGLARLLGAAHAEGLGVVLDVVYNHIGPGSEAIAAFGPYFTARHASDWGDGLDYGERGVREWAIQNAELWVGDYGVDGLRLDAVQAIHDDSPLHVLEELCNRVKALNPDALVISEMGREDLRPLERWGHDAMWLDSLHHELHVLLTGEREGYYESFGEIDGLVAELTRERPERLVVSAQNHDQIGNRAAGDRLGAADHRVALAVVLFSLSTPLLFMGEEAEETRPFQFFTDHTDPAIAEATRVGRAREFSRFAAFSAGGVPDPQAEETFRRSKLAARTPEPFFVELLALRPELPRRLEVQAEGNRVRLRRGAAELSVDFGAKTVSLRR
jgi:maltooligosyltrehalose trehalohydrolase